MIKSQNISTKSEYQAVFLQNPKTPLQLVSCPIPKPTPGGALLHTLYSEVCGTDVHLHHGRLQGVPYPIIPGHVSVGVIAALWGKFYDMEGKPFQEGDIVTFLDVHETCNNCWQCLVAKQTTRCPKRKVYGITYSANEGLLGGWSEAIWLKPGVKMIRIPKQLTPETYIGGGCGLVTALHAIDRAEIQLGQSLAVLGVGPVGQSIIAFGSLSGAGEIFAIGDPKPRLDFAKRMGATETLGLNIVPEERTSTVRQKTGGHGVDIVIEASGNPAAVTQALDLVRDGGRVVICGHYTDNGFSQIHPHYQINRKHIEIRGCWGSDFSHFYRAVQLTARFGNKIPWRDMVSQSYSLPEAQEALDAVAEQKVLKALITPNPGLIQSA